MPAEQVICFLACGAGARGPEISFEKVLYAVSALVYLQYKVLRQQALPAEQGQGVLRSLLKRPLESLP
jgi:hypothetical protein